MVRIVTSLFIILLVGCTAQSKVMTNSAKISAGMSKSELEELMGPPQNRQFEGTDEAWQYCATGFETDHFVLVWLSGDTVTGMKTYRNTEGFGTCDNFFRSVDWEESPDISVEVRER